MALSSALEKVAETAGKAQAPIEETSSGVGELGKDALDSAEKFKGMGGKIAAVAAVMAGPLGVALGTVLPALIEMGAKALFTKDAVSQLTEKMAKDAEQTENTRVAKERFRTSQEGVSAAIRDGTQATKDGINGLKTTAEQANAAAIEVLKLAESIRKATAAKLADAVATAEFTDDSAVRAASGEGGDQARIYALQRVADLKKAQAKADADAAEASVRLNVTRVQLAVETAEYESTAIGKTTREYDDKIKALQLTAIAQARAGKTIDGTLTREIVLLKQKRQAAIDAAAEQERLNKASAGNASTTSSFILPVSGGRISSGFGPRKAPTAGASTFHKGVDIAAPIGTPVKAAAGGLVIYAGKLPGFGNAIIVDHGNGTITEYGHLSQVLTKKNAQVAQGEKIGAVGNEGISTGPHLDYRVKVGGRYVNPLGGRFRTDENAVSVRGATAREAEQRRAEAEQAARERKAEQERDFVSGIENTASTRGQAGQSNSLNAQIARALAEFKKRFDREASGGETARITDALTEADARETAARFDEAYVKPLQRLKDLQGQTGIERAVMNAQLEESERRYGPATAGLNLLSDAENNAISVSIKRQDALQRENGILESVKAPLQEYADQIAALNALLAEGSISQDVYNSRVGNLATSARAYRADLPGTDLNGNTYSDQAKKDQANDQFNQTKVDIANDPTIQTEAERKRLLEANERRHKDTILAIDRAKTDALITGARSTTDSLLSIAEDSVGKQSAVYKGLFIVSKAFAIAESVIAIQRAIAQALAMPFPSNIPAIAAVAAQAASIVSNIKAVTLNLADGGQVRRQGGQGLLRGPGGPRGDAIPVNGSDGEFMVNAAAVRRGGNLAMLEAMNSGALTAGLRRASNDNAASRVAATGGGDSFSFSFGDVVVQAGNASSADGQVIGQSVKAQINALVDERIANAKRPGGVLTRGGQSVMSG